MSSTVSFPVTVPDGTIIAGERRPVPGAPAVVLLHAGVADRRAWHAVLDLLDGDPLDLIAYDRRGYGETPGAADGFSHLDDLLAVLDAAGAQQAVLVGNSMGGALALDLALTAPKRVQALLLVAAGVSGMTDEGEEVEWAPDAATGRILEALEAAEAAKDIEEQVRLELHLWLDGPAMPEGRVGGAARELAADMNRRILSSGLPGSAGSTDLDAWHRLGEIHTPTITTWGEYDLPPDLPFYRIAADRLPEVTERVLPGVAHLPSLERPDLVAALIREAVALGRPA